MAQTTIIPDKHSGARFPFGVLLFEAFASTMAMMSFAALIGPTATLSGLAAWHVGAATTIAGIAWMLSARWWGALSDAKGRRPIALIGLTGFAICFALLCIFLGWATQAHLPLWAAFVGLLIGRTLAGFFYAAVPATSAALVSDHFTPDARTSALAALGAANGAGMVIGPALTALIAARDLQLALMLLSLLPAASLVVVWRALPRRSDARAAPIAPLRLTDVRIRTPLLVSIVVMYCISAAQILVGFYVIGHLGLPPSHAAWASGGALAIVGVGLIAGQLTLRRLQLDPGDFIPWGALFAAAGFFLTIFAAEIALLWFSHFIAAFGFGLILPSLQAMAANAVEPTEKGAAAGAISSAMGLGIVLGPIVGLLAYELEPRAPYVLMFAVFALTAIALLREKALASPGPPPDRSRVLETGD